MTFEVSNGSIEARWAEWNRAAGAFGPALGPAADVPGRNGLRQSFQRGEIATSPDEGMVVSAFRLWDQAFFEWSIPPGGGDSFRFDVLFRPIGQDAWDIQGFDQYELDVHGEPLVTLRLQGFGDYQFHVRTDDDDSRFSVPVTVHLGSYDETPDPGNHIEVAGLFAERWHGLGAWDGPLGMPVSGQGPTGQTFDHGEMLTAPAFGSGMVVAAYQRYESVEVSWGGSDTAYVSFQVDAWLNGEFVARQNVTMQEDPFGWARRSVGSGSVVFDDLAASAEGNYSFYVYPGIDPGTYPPDLFPPDFAGAAPPVTVFVTKVRGDVRLPYPPLDASPAQAFASHQPRANTIARQYASRRPLGLRLPQPDNDNPEATENVAFQLMGHLQRDFA